jgi:hypothetical protein
MTACAMLIVIDPQFQVTYMVAFRILTLLARHAVLSWISALESSVFKHTNRLIT